MAPASRRSRSGAPSIQNATTQRGMAFFAASGDNGATDFCEPDATQICGFQTSGFPTDMPWVVSVGGTTLALTRSRIAETAWSGSGSGVSKFAALPAYQQRLPEGLRSQLNNQRGVPDVAAMADPYRALGVYFHGHWLPIGGTSASSPLWSGIMTFANQMAGRPLDFINPAIYQIGTSDKARRDFRDITGGGNTNTGASVQGFAAAPGWDPVTGFGAPVADHPPPDLIAAAS
jgi:subtilase family serine protease